MDSEEENSPAAPAGIWTRNLSIMNPVLYPTSYPSSPVHEPLRINGLQQHSTQELCSSASQKAQDWLHIEIHWQTTLAFTLAGRESNDKLLQSAILIFLEGGLVACTGWQDICLHGNTLQFLALGMARMVSFGFVIGLRKDEMSVSSDWNWKGLWIKRKSLKEILVLSYLSWVVSTWFGIMSTTQDIPP